MPQLRKPFESLSHINEQNHFSECSFAVMKLIRNSKRTNKTPKYLTDITKMITNMGIFPRPDYEDISEIVENKNPLNVLKVSFTIAKLP